MYGLKRKRFKREVRRRRCLSAWITADGLMTHECRLNNLSLSGAELVVEVANVLPSRFEIGLVPNSAKTKRCEVVWRQGRTIGVKFIAWERAYGSPSAQFVVTAIRNLFQSQISIQGSNVWYLTRYWYERAHPAHSKLRMSYPGCAGSIRRKIKRWPQFLHGGGGCSAEAGRGEWLLQFALRL
jgi:hypothetical protein